MAKFDIQNIKARADQAFATKEMWRSTLQDAYEYFLPQRETWNKYSPGQRKTNRIFDSSGQVAIKEFANRMMANITPQGTIWAEMELGIRHTKEDREDKEILRKLSVVNETLFEYIAQSNFYTMMGESYLDLAIGTAGLTVEEGDAESPLIFSVMDQAESGYEAGPTGMIENVFRKREQLAMKMDRAYPGGNFSSGVNDAIKSKDIAKKVIVIECMLFDPGSKEYWIVAYEEGETNFIWEVNRGRASPWIVYRWAVVHGETRGRGPVLDALPDQMSLNKVKEMVLQRAALELAGLWTGQDDGIFNPYTINVTPGVVIPVSTNLTSNPSLQRLDTGGDLQLTQFEVADLKASVKSHLFNDLRDPNGAVRSATEVSINQRELAERIGSNFTRIQNEALVKVLNSSMAVLRRLGLVPDLRLDGSDIAVRFTSPLSRSQDIIDIERLQGAIATTAQLAGPEAVNVGFKLDEVPAWVALKAGVDPHLIRSKTEVEEMLKSMAEMQAAQQAAQQEGQTVQ